MKYVHIVQDKDGNLVCAMLNAGEVERFVEEAEAYLEVRTVPLVQSELAGSSRARLFDEDGEE